MVKGGMRLGKRKMEGEAVEEEGHHQSSFRRLYIRQSPKGARKGRPIKNC